MSDIDLRLPAHCSTVDAEDLRIRLVMAADRGEGIRIDASETRSIGQAVLQLLVAARIEAEVTAQPFAIEQLDPALAERLARLGFSEPLGLVAEKDRQS